MKSVSSPLRYPGGKSKAIEEILPLIPGDFEEYREPFIGGASIYLSVKQKYPDKKYWINDLYSELFNFWKVCQEQPKEMMELLLKWKKEYENGKMLQQYLRHNMHKFNNVELASAYLVKNRTSFSGFEGGFSEISYHERFTKSNIESLRDVSEALQGTYITNFDYSKIVEHKPRDNIKEENVFIVCDPPYYNVVSAELYGKDGSLHHFFDHQRFANVMKNITDTTDYKWLITYDDSNTIRKLFDWANKISWNLKYSSRTSKMGKEIFITNMNISKVESKQLTIDNAWN